MQRRNISTIFKKRNLNTILRPDGTKDDSLERWYATQFDDRFPNIIRQVSDCLERRSNFSPRPRDRDFITQFFYNHTKRSPDFNLTHGLDAKFEGLFDEIVSEVHADGRFSSPEKRLLDDPKFRQRVMNNARVKVLSQQPLHILEMLSRFSLVVAVPSRTNRSFIVASQPVLRLTNDSNTDLALGDVELWMTVSPDIAIGLVARSPAPQVIKLNDKQVRHINLNLFAQSVSIASRSEALLQSIVAASDTSLDALEVPRYRKL